MKILILATSLFGSAALAQVATQQVTDPVNIVCDASSNCTIGASSTFGNSTFGSFQLETQSTLVASTNYGGFQFQGSAAKFRDVTCVTLGTASAGTNGTLAIFDVTGSAALCSGTFTCGSAKDVAVMEFDCNAAPVTGHMYAMRLTTGCGTTQPTALLCVVEMSR